MISGFLANGTIDCSSNPVFDHPSNHGLDYEDVTFKTEDGITLKGWIIKGDEDKVIIQSHFGTSSSRCGYTPKGKGFLQRQFGYKEEINYFRHVIPMVEAGYTVLMYDLRNHGESDPGKISYLTGGRHESRDIVAAVDFISKHSVYKDSNIGLMSICVSFNSTIRAYQDNKLQKYNNIKCIYGIQAADFDSIYVKIAGPRLRSSIHNQIYKKTGIKWREDTWEVFASKITVPTLVWENKNNNLSDLEWTKKLYCNIKTEKELKIADVNKLRFEGYKYPGDHPEELIAYFDKYLRQKMHTQQENG